MIELEAAYFDLSAAMEAYGDVGMVITVYDDPRALAAGNWHISVENSVPFVYMSDALYARYCADIGMVNTNGTRYNTSYP